MNKISDTKYIELDFDQARAKHMLFKSRLRSLLYGVEVEEQPVVSHFECDLGKWIYGHALKQYNNIPEIQELEKVHEQIHSVAKQLVELYKKGNEFEARKRLSEVEEIADVLIDLLQVAENKIKETSTGDLIMDANKMLKSNLEELIELKKANYELDKRIQQSEEQFNTLVNSIPNLAWMADGEGYIFWYNQRWYEYTGTTAEEMKGWGWQSVHDPEVLPQVLKAWKYSIETGKNFEMVFPIKGADNIFRSFLTRVFPIHDKEGKVIRWFGSNTDINEQNQFLEQLEETVKESNTRFKTILQYAPDAVITIDENGNIMTWNPQAELIFGWKESEVIGRTLTETIIPERYRQKHEQGLKHFLISGDGPVINKPIEISALKKDQTEFPVELKISSSKINGRHMFIGFIRDISVRKHAEETLNNKTMQLMEAQQLAHIGSWEWDISTNKIEWSDELFRIYGLKPQEFEANYESFLKYVHDEDRDMVDSEVKKAFNDHQPFSFYHKLVQPDGMVRILSSRGKVITDNLGNPIRMAGTAQDITEQFKYKQDLKESEERFLKIFDSNPVPMTLTEIKTNKIKYANNLFYNAFGYSSFEVIGHTTDELQLMAPKENERVVAIILKALHEQRPIEELQQLSVEETEELLYKFKQTDAMKNFEIEYTRKNGNTFPALVSFEMIRFGNDRFIITSYLDITQRKIEQEQLKLQNIKLEMMNKELKSFAYVSSHDLQEPLRKIQTFASRILEKEIKNLSHQGKDHFLRMFKAAKRMQTLIEDLLSYSRTNLVDLEFETKSLELIIQEVVEELKDEILQMNARIDIKESCELKIIPFQFRQLFHNLLSNSLKFSRAGIPAEIIITCKIENGYTHENLNLIPHQKYCHIIYKDNGIGFEQLYSEKIFDLFQRLHGKETYDGTGIGLAIVKKIVENHNGFITAIGELDQGAVFEIFIPVE